MKANVIIHGLQDCAYMELIAATLPERAALMLPAEVSLAALELILAKLPPARAFVIDPNTSLENAVGIARLIRGDITLCLLAGLHPAISLAVAAALKPRRGLVLDDLMPAQQMAEIASVIAVDSWLIPHPLTPYASLLAAARALNTAAGFQLPPDLTVENAVNIVNVLAAGSTLVLRSSTSLEVAVAVARALPAGCKLHGSNNFSSAIKAAIAAIVKPERLFFPSSPPFALANPAQLMVFTAPGSAPAAAEALLMPRPLPRPPRVNQGTGAASSSSALLLPSSPQRARAFGFVMPTSEPVITTTGKPPLSGSKRIRFHDSAAAASLSSVPSSAMDVAAIMTSLAAPASRSQSGFFPCAAALWQRPQLVSRLGASVAEDESEKEHSNKKQHR